MKQNKKVEEISEKGTKRIYQKNLQKWKAEAQLQEREERGKRK